MGRTQSTYRMRLQNIRDRLTKLSNYDNRRYHDLWQVSHKLSAPASTFPYPDSYAITTFSMILEAISRIENLKNEIDHLDED